MSSKFLSKEKENFIKRSFKGLGYWFLSCFMCIFVCSTMVLLMNKILFLKIFVAFCTTTITLGLFFNWSHYAAKRDKNTIKYHNMKYDKYMPAKMAIIAPIVSYIMFILLLLCKMGIITDTFISIYLLCDIWILPYITMFTEDRTIAGISNIGLIGIGFLTLLQPATIIITYLCTYNDIDVVKHIFYKKDNNPK